MCDLIKATLSARISNASDVTEHWPIKTQRQASPGRNNYLLGFPDSRNRGRFLFVQVRTQGTNQLHWRSAWFLFSTVTRIDFPAAVDGLPEPGTRDAAETGEGRVSGLSPFFSRRITLL